MSFIFLAITAPNGLFVETLGPVPGSATDRTTMNQSNMNVRLADLFSLAAPNPEEEPLGNFKCLGDAIFSNSPSFVRVHSRAAATPEQRAENKHMSGQVRLSVEHMFGKVISLWKHLDKTVNNRILVGEPEDVARKHRVSYIFTNFHSILNGSQTSLWFMCDTPSFEDYVLGRVHRSRINDSVV